MSAGFEAPNGPRASKLDRRDFLQLCSMAAVALGLPASAAAKIAAAVERKQRPSVVWMHFQECTGCTESLLRTSHPTVQKLILELISLDYHETLFAAAGHQAEAALESAVKDHKGEYICIVEGAVPTKDGGLYCKIGDRTALDLLEHVAGDAGAIIAIGSCASFGGLPAADPNPTGAKGIPAILEGKTVVTLPGCPPNPYNLLNTVLHFLTYGRLPALDELGRPMFAYGRTIHEDCPRRPHFDAGRFAHVFGDQGHRDGYCLYKLGCKGPETHANCAVKPFCEVPGAWPIGIGHPCVGCTEQALAFRAPMFSTSEILQPTPPSSYPVMDPDRGHVSAVATGLAGLAVGAAAGAGLTTSRRLSQGDETTDHKPSKE